MSQESGITVFSGLSPSDISIQHPNSVLEDTSDPLSPPFCVPDSAFYISMPQSSSMKVLDNANLQLHRSSEPYRPPCRLKASPPSSKDGNDLLNSDTCGSSESTNQEKAEGERWSKGMITLPNEDIWYSCKNTDSHEYSEEFMLSARNVNTLHSTPNVINQQSDASQKPSLIQGDAVQPSILPESTKGCCTQLQQGQKFVNRADTSLNTLSELDDSKFHVMEPLQNSKPSNFLSQENHGNIQKNHVEEKQFSSAGFELFLPDEDSLINFDETFLMPDFENSAVVEKLVESILNDESCPAPHLDDPIVHHDKIRRFDHAVSQSMFQQMMNPGKQHLPLQNRTYGPSMGSTPDLHSDGSINQAVLDMNLRARQWHPYMGGF